MKVYTLFFGGSSYALPDPERDTEEFSSMKEAMRAFENRFHDPYYPCVDTTAEMRVFFGLPLEQEGYPDRRILKGKRGGVRIERV